MSGSNFQTDLVALYRKAISSGLSLDEVRHKIERHVARLQTTNLLEAERAQTRKKQQRATIPRAIRWGAILIPVVFIGVGFYLVGSAVMPILGYYVAPPEHTNQNKLTSPIPEDEVLDVTPLVITQTQTTNQLPNTPPLVIDETLDYTNLVNWFDAETMSGLVLEDKSQVGDRVGTEYQLDIPALNLENVMVKVGGSQLDKNLVAYPGTALPGEYGAPVIFGHSILRQFYNPSPKNPRRYMSVFSTIMTLKVGDKIFLTYDDVKYTYMVQSKKEVQPTDVQILTQQYDARRLKLVTCVPEGTYLRRGVVTAQLVTE
ncbi:sortase [Patescibacteria group bacterium]|nr:sortase [Patescibacteria group bacterium]